MASFFPNGLLDSFDVLFSANFKARDCNKVAQARRKRSRFTMKKVQVDAIHTRWRTITTVVHQLRIKHLNPGGDPARVSCHLDSLICE